MEVISRTMLYVNSDLREQGEIADCLFRFPGAILDFKLDRHTQYTQVVIQLDAIHIPLNIRAAAARPLRILKVQSSLTGGAYGPKGRVTTLAEFCVIANLYNETNGPMNQAYFSFRTQDPVQTSLSLSDRSFDLIRIFLTDQDDVKLDDSIIPHNWHAKFAVSMVRDTGAEMIATLQQIADFTRLQMIGNDMRQEAEDQQRQEQQNADLRRQHMVEDLQRVYSEIRNPADNHETILNPHAIERIHNQRTGHENPTLRDLTMQQLEQLPRQAFFSDLDL